LGAFLVVALVSFVSVARHPFRLRIRPFELPIAASYRWSVVLVPEGEGVPVRGGPDHPHEIVARIPAGTHVVEGTGRRNRMNGTLWVEVKTADGVGWVDGITLTPLVDPGLVGGDPRLQVLLAELSDAIVSGRSIEHHVSGRGLHYLKDGEIMRIPLAYVDEALSDMWTSTSVSTARPGSPQSAARALLGVMRTDLAFFEPPTEFANFSQVVVGEEDPWFLFFEYGPEGSPLLVAMAPAVPTDVRR
jgi:hypothetical protein